jgi:hypothetical protein
LEVKKLKAVEDQLRNAIGLIYSVVVIATIIPGFPRITSLVVIPYFLIVPGYFVTRLIRNEGITARLFYSVVWSITILAAVYSLTSIQFIVFLPLQLIIPAFTIVLMTYDYSQRARSDQPSYE